MSYFIIDVLRSLKGEEDGFSRLNQTSAGKEADFLHLLATERI